MFSPADDSGCGEAYKIFAQAHKGEARLSGGLP